MREIRSCPLTGQAVLINDGWVDRPAPPVAEAACWYCSPRGPVLARDGEIVVVPHPVPALGVEGDDRVVDEGLGALRREAVGAHELIYGPHDASDVPLLAVVRHRIHDLRNDRRLRGFRAVRRHRPGAHVAWQLVALPFDVPPLVAARWRDEEVRRGTRVVAQDANAVAIAAWAPRVPFETWVLPRADDDVERGELAAVAGVLPTVIAALEDALDGAPIDLVLEDGAPWRIVLLPRLTVPNAVDVATGLSMHGVFPEEAARFLRRSAAR